MSDIEPTIRDAPEPTYKSVKRPPTETIARKLKRRGVGALSSTELLTVVLGGDYTRADELVRRFGLNSLADLTASEAPYAGSLMNRVYAVFELGRRVYSIDVKARPRITRPKDAYDAVTDIRSHRKEHLVGLYLDAQHGLIHRETITIGSLNTTRSSPREIFFPAIQHCAFGFILAHNHPSGGLDPSDEDIAFTRAVQRSGEVLGIELFDHVIVTPEGYTSLRERGIF
jgi:DNA repair protein RadC